MPAKLLTSAGGGITLDAASTATDKTITIPAVTGTMAYVDTGGSVVLPRVNSGSEGGQVDFQRASDAVVTWSIDSYGSTSTPALRFIDGSNERMRIDSSGNLLVGTTSANVGFTTGSKSIVFDNSYGTNYAIVVNQNSASNGYFMGFGRGGSQCGYIWTSASNTTAYVTSSDYRLKENVQPMTGALEKVTALKPCTYTWKEDGTASQGFIAHELQAVVPECVAGEKDAVDAEGNPQYQGIDTSFLVATLTAAIQEQQAIIQTLTSRIEALENPQ